MYNIAGNSASPMSWCDMVIALSDSLDDVFEALKDGPVYIHILVDIRRKKGMQHLTLNLSRNLPVKASSMWMVLVLRTPCTKALAPIIP